MRILVYGAGAVGCFWGALLQRGGHDVHFVARGAQLNALRAHGIGIRSLVLGDVRVQPVSVATHVASDVGYVDLVLLCVKAHQMPAALGELGAALDTHTVIIPLQNGIEGHTTLAARFGGERVLGSVVYVGAAIEEPGVVRHMARGMLILGNPFDVPADRLDGVCRALQVPGLDARLADDFERQLWLKLMWNASFNAVSALTLQDSKTLLRLPGTRVVIEQMMREVVAVAQARGTALTDGDAKTSLDETDRLPGIRTSMLEDRIRGRLLESDALVGVVVRLGAAAGVATPISSSVLALLEGIDAGRPPT